MSTPTIIVGGKPVALYGVSITNGVVYQPHLGCVEEHRTGRNWIAIVEPNRARPGGLDRAWLERVRGLYYATTSIKAGDFIEVGGDRVTSVGKRYRNRRYFRILIVREQTWVLRDADAPEDTLTIPPIAPEVEAVLRALRGVQEEAPVSYSSPPG